MKKRDFCIKTHRRVLRNPPILFIRKSRLYVLHQMIRYRKQNEKNQVSSNTKQPTTITTPTKLVALLFFLQSPLLSLGDLLQLFNLCFVIVTSGEIAFCFFPENIR